MQQAKQMKNATDFETLNECLRYCVGSGNPFKPPKEWAGILDLALSTLYAKGNPEGTVPFTIRDLITVVSHGVTLPLEFLALMAKCVVFPMPDIDPDGDPLDAQVADSTIKCGEFLKQFGQARKVDSPGGRKIAPEEAAPIMARSLEMVTIHASIAQAMQRIINQDK